MVFGDRHIEYLVLVRRGEIVTKRSIITNTIRYVSTASNIVDQTVATQMKALGATRIAYVKGKGLVVSLSPLGEKLLIDEDEAWA